MLFRSRPTATITGSTQICPGASTLLTLNFTGTGPWSGVLSNGQTFSSSANQTTLSVSPSSTTTYSISSLNDNNCGATSGISGSATVVVNPTNTIALSSAAGSNAQSLCINNAITSITYSTTGATGATVSGLPTGVTGSWAANVFTISGTPSQSGTFNYTVTMTGGCTGGTNTASGSIVVNPTKIGRAHV